MAKALVVGGCPASYHRLEPTEQPLRAALEGLGLEVDFSGIYHPGGGEAYRGDYSALSGPYLPDYDLVVLYTTGNERHGADVTTLQQWLEDGKALVGIHCATDSFTDSEDFVALMGGKFRTHPAQLHITTEIVDSAHPITAGLDSFTVHDELYLFSDYHPGRVHLLAQTHSFDDNGHPVPIAWTREPGKGRLFYLSLGHNPSTLHDASWQKFFQQGVEWTLNRR